MIATLRAPYEPITLHAVETDEPSCFAQLAGGDLDIVVSVETSGAPQQDDPRLHRTPLLSDVLDAVLPAGHRCAGVSAVALEDLATEAWVLALPGPPVRRSAASQVRPRGSPPVRPTPRTTGRQPAR